MARIEFETNYAKAIEAILYVLEGQPSVNLYNVLKSIFEADKLHLNRHGRPVTGDTYIKMQYGTVPSAIYDMLKGDPIGLAELGEEAYPFFSQGYHLTAKRPANLDLLSESDIEALDEGIRKYRDLPFHRVKEINHREPCWQAAQLNCPIDFALMIENPEVREMLEEMPLRQIV